MYGIELATKIRSECKYTGTNRAEYYVYMNAIENACTIVMRELPDLPAPEPAKEIFKKSKMSKKEED